MRTAGPCLLPLRVRDIVNDRNSLLNSLWRPHDTRLCSADRVFPELPAKIVMNEERHEARFMQRYLSFQKCVSFRLVQLHVANSLSRTWGSVLSIEPLQNWLFVFDLSPESYENGECI